MVLPNPSRNQFIFSIESKNESPLSIRIIDAQGRVVSRLLNQTSNTIKFGDDLLPGLYFAEVIKGSEKTVMKLVKL